MNLSLKGGLAALSLAALQTLALPPRAAARPTRSGWRASWPVPCRRRACMCWSTPRPIRAIVCATTRARGCRCRPSACTCAPRQRASYGPRPSNCSAAISWPTPSCRCLISRSTFPAPASTGAAWATSRWVPASPGITRRNGTASPRWTSCCRRAATTRTMPRTWGGTMCRCSLCMR
uniref:Uncharacterized protein n=1 Tax=Burkholderia cepacia TaxID=292 RepID=Q93L10_BURCE|nr:unknown [Burkholderia cepacia]